MLLQEQMIARVRELCAADERVVAALMYGSFTKDEADAYSDIEFFIYLDELAFQQVDPAGWVAQVAPLALFFVNEFGVGSAIFENLVRGEFHFEPATAISAVRNWRSLAAWPAAERMLILDRTGELADCLAQISGPGPQRDTPENIAFLWHSFLNWTLFGSNVLARGEHARALELLWFVQRYLLWLARLQANETGHWQTPSRLLERDLPADLCQRYRTCSATLDPVTLARAYRSAWSWGCELIAPLAQEYGVDPLPDLVARLSQQLAAVTQQVMR